VTRRYSFVVFDVHLSIGRFYMFLEYSVNAVNGVVCGLNYAWPGLYHYTALERYQRQQRVIIMNPAPAYDLRRPKLLLFDNLIKNLINKKPLRMRCVPPQFHNGKWWNVPRWPQCPWPRLQVKGHRESASRSGRNASTHHRGLRSGVSFTWRPGDTHYRNDP